MFNRPHPWRAPLRRRPSQASRQAPTGRRSPRGLALALLLLATAAPAAEPKLQPKALEILKAASARLAAAKTMRFTAVATYESPSRYDVPLAYTVRSDVTLQRPDKLRVLTPGDGKPSDFYYNGKTMTAWSPEQKLLAVADAPPTIDGVLKAAYAEAAIYFPFVDVLVADPYKDLADGLEIAFVIGQSHVVGGTTTDIIAIADKNTFAQLWIGADDHLPRRIRAVYGSDPARLRHDVEFSNWQIDGKVPADTFTAPSPAGATRIGFARPDPKFPPGVTLGPTPTAAAKQ